MEADVTNGKWYRVTVEADATWLQDTGYVTKVVAQWREGGTQGELVDVPVEHLDTLRRLRHVRQIVPAEVVRSISEGTADDTPSGTSASARSGGATSVLERDPVCGMKLPPGHEVANVTYDGRTFHFCSLECRDIFLKDPRPYVAGNPGREQPVAS